MWSAGFGLGSTRILLVMGHKHIEHNLQVYESTPSLSTRRQEGLTSEHGVMVVIIY